LFISNPKESAMSDLTKEQRKGEIAALRARIKANPALHVEVLAALVGAFRQNGITIDGRVVADLTIALPEEVTNEMTNVVLPGGTNCGLS
jgi:hypothetical protein